MAWQVLDSDYRSDEINENFPGGNQTWGLLYNPETGDYKVVSKGVIPGMDPWDQPLQTVFYENGAYYNGGISHPDFFPNRDVNSPTQKASDFSIDIRRKVRAAHTTMGGNAAGANINQTALNPTGPYNGNAQWSPSAQPGVSSSIPGVGPILTLPPTGPQIDPTTGRPVYSTFISGSANENTLFGSSDVAKNRLLYYPLDILDGQQDVLKISMYNYAPPGAAAFRTGGAGIAKTIALGGLQRGSAAVVGKEKFKSVTILPIPNNVADTNAVGWNDAGMNNLTAALVAQTAGKSVAQGGFVAGLGALTGAGAAAMYGELLNNIGGNLDPNSDLGQVLKTSLTSTLLKQGGIDVSPEEILARGFGIIPNSNLELLFSKVTLRTFDFSWNMTPRSELEARNIRRIIRQFKQGMAARRVNSSGSTFKAGETSYFLGSPNVFKLSYRTADDKPIAGLNRFKLCALTNFSVNYAPSGQWSAFDGGMPTGVTIGMNFAELEPVYENDYQEDILGGTGINEGVDLDKITADDVGY